MPSSDRTTLSAAIAALVDELSDRLVADPPTPSSPLRRIIAGAASVEGAVRPVMAVRLSRVRTLSAADDDRLMEASIALLLATDAGEADAHERVLALTGAVEDALDALRETGVIEGADGLDDRSWDVRFAAGAAGSRVATAEAAVGLVVRVAREDNG